MDKFFKKSFKFELKHKNRFDIESESQIFQTDITALPHKVKLFGDNNQLRQNFNGFEY